MVSLPQKSGSDEIERLAEERYGDSVMPRFDLEIETCHLITNNVGEGAFDEQTAFVVPENCVFALGDNRNISSDSRSRGAFPMEDVIGVVKAKGMGLVYAVIAVLAVLLAVFLVADAVKTKRAEAVRVGRGEKSNESADESGASEKRKRPTPKRAAHGTKRGTNNRLKERSNAGKKHIRKQFQKPFSREDYT